MEDMFQLWEVIACCDRCCSSSRGRLRAVVDVNRRMTDRFVYAKLFVMSMVGTSEAARRLGVTSRQVQHLVARGDLRLVARGYVDLSSVERFAAVRAGARTRAWSETTAWGAVALLSGEAASWMGERQQFRLKSRLREIDADGLLAQCRNRAVVRTYAGHPRALDRVRSEIASTHESAQRLGLSGTNAVDGYVAADQLQDVALRYALVEDAAGSITLRATTMSIDVVTGFATGGTVLAGLDLAESADVRERSAGVHALEQALSDFRG